MRSLHSLTGQLLPPERIYSSVYAIGEWPGSTQSLVDKVGVVAESIDFPPIELYFDSVLSFPGRPLHIRSCCALVATRGSCGNSMPAWARP